MSVTYDSIHWAPQKKVYDKWMIGLMALYLVLFCGFQLVFFPEITPETLIIRATGTLAFLMLHIILCIGPLCRLDRRFLPLLYNRRHLGVATFLVSAIHGVFNTIQFHAFGNVNPLFSLLTSNTDFTSLQGFPFQILGLLSLIILFLMAATSHDFWLNRLSPRVWKTLHMSVYAAYAMLMMHVMLGVIQLEKSPVLIGITGLGLSLVVGLHLLSALAQLKTLRRAVPAKQAAASEAIPKDFVYACTVDDIPENCAKMLIIKNENIAIFKYDGKVSAVHNLCKHQNGPLSEGRIIDGCITCPWHGYQYLPENGQSPPPFTEKLHTYDVHIDGEKVYINPKPYPEGTSRPPAIIPNYLNPVKP